MAKNIIKCKIEVDLLCDAGNESLRRFNLFKIVVSDASTVKRYFARSWHIAKGSFTARVNLEAFEKDFQLTARLAALKTVKLEANRKQCGQKTVEFEGSVEEVKFKIRNFLTSDPGFVFAIDNANSAAWTVTKSFPDEAYDDTADIVTAVVSGDEEFEFKGEAEVDEGTASLENWGLF